MKWYNPINWFKSQNKEVFNYLDNEREKVLASYNLTYTNVQTISFNGEKNPGAAGPMIDYKPQYAELRVRSWQAMLESDIAQIGMNKLITWVIGKGLKLQSEPVKHVLEEEGIRFDKNKFTKTFESRFHLWKKSKSVDYSGLKNLDELSTEAERNAVIGGDVLVVLRVIKGELKIQLIDGQHVQSPYYGSEWFPKQLPNGHSLIDGVEINEKREHVAYWVKVYALDASFENLYKYSFERIPAKGSKTNATMAYLYYGSQYRINNVRGIPLIAACFEKLTNLDLYSAATLKQAQEAAKVDYQVVHDKDSTPATPWAGAAALGQNIFNDANTNNKLPETDDGATLGKTTHITGIGTAWNNSPGSRVETLENKNPLYFKDFYETHTDIFFAVLQMPPNVAMGKYNNSFSASRAAIKDWEHVLMVKRENHYNGFLKPILSLFLDLQVLQNKIQAPGYIVSMKQGNKIVIDCYKNCRFVGANVPHIDPLKEVKAARELLGKAFEFVPLNDVESVTEALGCGDASENIEQGAQELNKAEGLGLKARPIEQAVVKTVPVKKKSGVKNKI